MPVPDFLFSDADVIPGRMPEVSDPNTSDLYKKLKKKFSIGVATFLASHVGFEDDEFEWEGVRPLGQGSFGTVGLWAAKNNKGVTVKELAVKQCDQPEGKDRIPREALIMNQLNQFQCSNILRLENFKIYSEHYIWRYYLELCPYGNLEEIWTRCKAYGHYLPEEFLWHVFHGLAQAARVMSRGPFRSLTTNEPTRCRLLHLDIKPANVMLGHKSEKSLFKSYPVVKLADFGLAQMTGPSDIRNPVGFHGCGSAAYMPPEHRPYRMTRNAETGKKMKSPKFENWSEAPIRDNEQLESRSNIWPMGMVIYLLMTLTDIQIWVIETDRIPEEDFIRLGRHFVEPIQTGRRPEYSERLRDLVHECLNPNVKLRPTASNLLTRTRAGLESFRTTSETGNDTTKAPPLRHLNRSKSVLPAGQDPQAYRVDVGGPSIRAPSVTPKPATWEPPRRTGRARSPSLIPPPIHFSDDSAISPPTCPLTMQNKRDGKRRRITNEDEEASIPGKRMRITNIAGEVIVISPDSTFAAEGDSSPDPSAVAADGNGGDNVREPGHGLLSEKSSGHARRASSLAKYGSSQDNWLELREYAEDEHGVMKQSKASKRRC